MIVTDIILGADMEERILYENPLLQHSMYVVDYDHYERELIPWHWHGEIELLYLESGSCGYRTIETAYELSAGDAIYLKSGVLHSFQPLRAGTVSYANLFMPEFLTGGAGSFWDLSYVAPLLSPSSADAIVLRRDDPNAARALELIRETIRLCQDEPEYYELRLRIALWETWMELHRMATRRQAREKPLKTAARDARLKKLLLLISERYAGPISVATLARAADISERECYRIFRESLGQTPIAFVQRYRLQQARAMLLAGSGTVTEIAGKTGFDSAAYFSKLFKRAFGVTPAQVKKENLAGSL
ncbi:MAG: helix-turn-helix transcriptional regulator [Clostridia bacterium]|nr:helix-turn-helix transcriptional regulator [Clostridia bacterium]